MIRVEKISNGIVKCVEIEKNGSSKSDLLIDESQENEYFSHFNIKLIIFLLKEQKVITIKRSI